MNIARTLLITLPIVFKLYIFINQDEFELSIRSDENKFGYASTSSTPHIDSFLFNSISYGHFTFHNHFINLNISVSRRHLSSCYSIERENVFLPICLLLCGDIHPCPGPTDTSSPTSSSTTYSDYSVFQKRGLHFLHINVRSLLPKLHEIDSLAKKSRAAIISISETWLDSSVPDSEISIENYCIERRDRNRHGGGVCIFIRKDLSYNSRDDLKREDLEAIFIELFLPKTKPILCGCLYRPPTQQNFYTILDELCSSDTHFLEHETILLGDFNTDVSCRKSYPLLQCFKSFVDMFHFKQLICNPTRFGNTSSTIIDLILTSDKDKISQSGVIQTSFSDHFVIFCTRKSVKSYIGGRP
ncbi:uncharacterized protein LOC127840502 [Dreissena polymorpha]|uniref:uncharacterized protein LOC127840502 n=1 Tax=Dreissena polymorpha TaxID=45954 RepID=UPI002263CEC3|nr:uncharacterized protein LOC127840502 [Dreissena polymorpha]